ncbi:LysR family transcriptional regulator [Comamonas aquatica]|uniref:LysR family transcriptional regulator n=1 Tax=Comamonas aquatica TaxID=225991 RepID=A0AA42W7R9_9BURK|nr:LysR family transcriptional regulator [Comamonas aquatica]MDH1430151.1 LysR family transcriptional regulator [Comamonas aquatica]MDH1607688.1 LysR family transcriptional regulator [Comamonas aquatica]MDH1619440.1 LysR family transcriptional regulator [Comamonas aquatica]MDH2007426.1 LysR family transcriptional regulator [Comamonas aquatica]
MDELRRIDLNLLLALHALLTEKHVTRAALRLHKSQPAVSHSLAQLREHFNDPLLVRKQGKLELTTRGNALLQPLSEALANLNNLLGTPQFDPLHAQRRFRLSLSDYAARLVMPDLMRYARQHAPGFDFAISQASRDAMLVQLADGELDLALGIFPEIPQDIRVETLFEEDFICLADKATIQEKGGLSLEEWLERPHVMLALKPDANEEIERALAAKGLKRRIAVALPHWSAAVELLSGTDLVLTIARRAVGPLRSFQGLRQFAPPRQLQLPKMAYQQAWHTRKDNDPALSWLRQVVMNGCKPNIVG